MCCMTNQRPKNIYETIGKIYLVVYYLGIPFEILWFT